MNKFFNAHKLLQKNQSGQFKDCAKLTSSIKALADYHYLQQLKRQIKCYQERHEDNVAAGHFVYLLAYTYQIKNLKDTFKQALLSLGKSKSGPEYKELKELANLYQQYKEENQKIYNVTPFQPNQYPKIPEFVPHVTPKSNPYCKQLDMNFNGICSKSFSSYFQSLKNQIDLQINSSRD